MLYYSVSKIKKLVPVLSEALKNDVISGAAIDVFKEEPLNENSPLLEDENEELGNTMIVGHFKNGLEEGEKDDSDS